jgi:hypothetical protein
MPVLNDDDRFIELERRLRTVENLIEDLLLRTDWLDTRVLRALNGVELVDTRIDQVDSRIDILEH